MCSSQTGQRRAVEEGVRAKKFISLTMKQTGTVSTGSYETISVQPPKGKIYKILGIFIEIPAVSGVGATSGNHDMYIYRGFINVKEDGVYAYNILYSDKIFSWGGERKSFNSPDTHIAFLEQLSRIYGTYDYPIKWMYRNRTDADQTQTRDVKFFVEILNELGVT